MTTCYVSIPFGVKADPRGKELDFDHLYHAVIKPVVQELQIDCRRLDEFLAANAIWHKALFTALISSDLMIADLSTHNANVLYELGVRHALRRGRTLLISAGGGLPLPVNVSHAQAILYYPDDSGRLTGETAKRFRDALQAAIRQSQRTIVSDSPIYEFFPDLEIILPPELESHRYLRRAPRASPPGLPGFVQSVVESPDRAIRELHKREENIRGAADSDPIEYLNLLRKYRDLSEWNRVISLALDAPGSIATSPEVQQLLALALNRRGMPGDRKRAIEFMERIVAETGGDSETFGILGSIYKGLSQEAKGQGDLARAAIFLSSAIYSYQKGFEKNPNDYYLGLNVVTLLLERSDDASSRELAKNILLGLRALLHEKREAGLLDFWELTADLQLAVIARDWPAAEQDAMFLTQKPQVSTEPILRDLRTIGQTLTDPGDRVQLEQVISILRQADARAESEQ